MRKYNQMNIHSFSDQAWFFPRTLFISTWGSCADRAQMFRVVNRQMSGPLLHCLGPLLRAQ